MAKTFTDTERLDWLQGLPEPAWGAEVQWWHGADSGQVHMVVKSLHPRFDGLDLRDCTDAAMTYQQITTTGNDLADIARAAEELERLERELAAARALLVRLRGWDMLDHASDGPYWRSEIDKLCAVHAGNSSESTP